MTEQLMTGNVLLRQHAHAHTHTHTHARTFWLFDQRLRVLVLCGCGQGCSSLNIRDFLVIILHIQRGNTFPQQSTPVTRSSVAQARTWRNTWWCLLFRPDSVGGPALTLPSFSSASPLPLFPSLSLSPPLPLFPFCLRNTA